MSKAGQYNISVNKNQDYFLTFQVKSGEEVLDITDYSFNGAVKTHHTSPDSVSITCTIVDAIQGLVNLHIEDTVTATMESGTQYWDLVMTDAGGIKTRLLEGKCFVNAGITS
jgi:hypothetical protein